MTIIELNDFTIRENDVGMNEMLYSDSIKIPLDHLKNSGIFLMFKVPIIISST